MLLNEAIRGARSRGASCVRLVPSKRAENFYLRKGFKPSEKYPARAELSLMIQSTNYDF